MSLNWQELEKVISEVNPLVLGSSVQKIAQTASFALGESVVFHTYSSGAGTQRLIFSCNNLCTGLFLAPSRSVKIDSPPSPSTFIMVLRKHLMGTRLKTIHQNPGDRMVSFFFENGRVLIGEFIPRRSNLLLLASQDQNTGKYLASFRSVRLNTGGLYPLPKAMGTSPKEVRSFNEFPGATYPEKTFHYFHSYFLTATFSKKKSAYLQKIRSQKKKLQTAIKNLNKDEEKIKGLDSMQESAHALQEKLYEFGAKNFPKELTVNISLLSSEKKITVSLDKKLTFAENLNTLFQRIKKIKRASGEIHSRMMGLEEKKSYLEDLESKVEGSNNEEEMQLFHKDLEKLQDPKRLQTSKKSKDYLEIVSSDGFVIFCGRNEKENRLVTFKVAKGNDLWLHLRGAPGAHVLIKSQKKKTVPLSTLLEAAQLVLYYSKARKGKHDVDYTFRKNVRAIKYTVAKVTYTENKVLYIESDVEKLRKLLQSQ